MSIELKIPSVGESVHEVQIARWLKSEGDTVARDETIVELDTDKASLELPAPEAGVLTKILKQEGEAVAVGDVIAQIDVNGKAESAPQKETASVATDKQPTGAPAKETHVENENDVASDSAKSAVEKVIATPSARRELRRHGLAAEDVPAAGKQLRPEDVQRFVQQQGPQQVREPAPAEKPKAKPAEVAKSEPKSKAIAHREPAKADLAGSDLEEVVPMSLIRRRIASRLVEAQQKAALLTTFNEIDMSAVMALRQEYREKFQERHGVKLGFMSFFVKATVDALKQQPELNAEIRDDSKIVYRHYYDIGVAIGGGKGLVVPVLRRAERMSFADIEQAIADFAARAQENKLLPDELTGGTFTISNGGVYGSLLSTPIVNPPQSGVLGMHTIQERPIALKGQVVIRPMMYVALTYDHRLVDGREAVQFLVRIKQAIEDPSRLLLEV